MELKMQGENVWRVMPRNAAGAQLTLDANEALGLTPKPRGIQVLCGLAWVTWRGVDYVLRAGERLMFTGGGAPVISSAGKGCVTVEMLR